MGKQDCPNKSGHDGIGTQECHDEGFYGPRIAGCTKTAESSRMARESVSIKILKYIPRLFH